MTALFGIELTISAKGMGPVQVFTGYSAQRYAFETAAAAQEFIDQNWWQFSTAWRRANLKPAPLPPCVTAPERYLKFDHHGDAP